MKIWLVNPFDPLPGEQTRLGRYAFFAKLLSEAGHTVSWWTSSFFHTTKSFRHPTVEASQLPRGVTVNVVPALAYYQNTSIRRLLSHVFWGQSFYAAACAAPTPPDVIMSSSPPLYASNRAIALARRYGAKAIVDVQDLWPEAFGVLFPSSLRALGMGFLRPLSMLADYNYGHADGVVAISQTLLNRALAPGSLPKVRCVIPLGVDVDVYECARSTCKQHCPWQKSADEFWVAYVGTIGRTYDVATILETARLLLHREPRVRFMIVGDGPLLADYREQARTGSLSNVTFTGRLPLDIMAQVLVQSDVGVNAIAANAVSAFPNKLFDYMAAGLPVVSSVRGELETFIREHHLGLSYQAGQPDSLQAAIASLRQKPDLRREMGARSRRLGLEMFDRKVAYQPLVRLISEINGK